MKSQKSQIALAVVVTALILGPAAFAASTSAGVPANASLRFTDMTPGQQCQALTGRWETGSAMHPNEAEYAEALKIFGQGQQLCQTHKERNAKGKPETFPTAANLQINHVR
jgi:hypothetical protein